MSLVKELLTAADLLHLPDDGYRYELIDGELIRMPLAGQEQGEICMLVLARLSAQVRPRRLGKVYGPDMGFIIGPGEGTVLAPDVSFVRADRLPAVRGTGFLHLTPDLLFEIMSPNDTLPEVDAKVARYLATGARFVVVVRPRLSRVRLYRSEAPTVELAVDDVLDLDGVVPGFRIPVAELFAEW